jgi:hypothetical protein
MKSGFSASTASWLGRNSLIERGVLELVIDAGIGPSRKAVPTMRLPRPSARSSSVAEDLIVTIRFGGALIGTDTPQLSMDAAVLAEALGVAFCAAGAPGPPMVDEHADRLMAAAMMTTMLLGKRRMTTL